ncbi:nuclear cap-binding protein subunit 1-like [Chenopodium quinoa]|uniref:nuclear cap-binding protein subunit 1-like n=1 Tax=Chenopodium quinoa TaxID=63459 RepID=UPI000B77FE1D|nr:nuclear cap-binding protein subunit 1-like [Chenopodium quinoa]
MSSWKTLILRIGEKCPEYGGTLDFKEHIDSCYGILWRELDQQEDQQILYYLLQCAEQLPHKSPFYATLIGLLNLEKEELGKLVVDTTRSNLQEAIQSENCDRIRVLLRFITVLMCSKVLQPGALVVVFETLLSSAATIVDEEKGNPAWQARADFYISCILSCLPWGGAELMEQVPEEIDRVLVGIQAYLSIRRHVTDAGFSIFVDNSKDQRANDKDFLEDLWSRIQDASNNGWKLESIPRPYLSFEAQLVAGKSHDFGPINCPEQPRLPAAASSVSYGRQKHDADLKYPQRIRKLNIFPQNKLEDLAPIDQFIMEEYLLDILLFLNGCRKECAAYMAGLPVPFRYEYLMAETVFSQLLLLPQPRFKPIYYALVIMDLCKALPGAFPAVVAGAVRALFDKIAELDMECRTRLILWFSHHLSNFQFIWPWEEWAYVLELPKWAPQRVFVQEVLEREVRLSYLEKIKQSIENAPGLEELLPPKGGPNFRFNAENGRNKPEWLALSEDLNGMVRGRQTAREIISWIDENVVPVHGLEVTLQVVIQTLLNIGSKSFTHLMTVLERYGQVIAKVCPDEDRQVMLISEVSTFWKNSTQMNAIAIDRMMGYRLISNLAIVRWVFSPENVDQFHTSDRHWEILRNAVSKTYNRICDLRKQIFSLKKRLQSAEEATANAKAEVEAAESKLTLMNGEPVVGDNPIKLKRLINSSEKAKEEEVSLRESLEAKEALLFRALGENEALFLSLYKNFSVVLLDRLPEDSPIGASRLLSSQTDLMTLDSDEPAGMDVDQEKGLNSVSNGDKGSAAYNLSETDQWGLSTLGYVKAITRQYASEIWPHVEKIDEEILRGNVHPLFRKAVYCGLGRITDEQ